MEFNNRKSVLDDLSLYDFRAKDSDWIEVIQWINEEGYDINIQVGSTMRHFSLNIDELEAINHLVGVIKFHKED